MRAALIALSDARSPPRSWPRRRAPTRLPGRARRRRSSAARWATSARWKPAATTSARDDSVTVDVSGVKVGAAKPSPAPRAPAAAAPRAPRSLARAIDLLRRPRDRHRRAPHRRPPPAADVHTRPRRGPHARGPPRSATSRKRPRLPALRRRSSVVVNRGRHRAHADPRHRPRLAARGHEDPRRRRDRRPPRTPVVATPTADADGHRDRHRPTPKAKKTPKRQARPKVPKRLTGQRYAFPVYGKATVADDFGAARADTGVHQGNDVFAPFGAPVLAVADGTVHRVGTLPISGNRLWLHTDAGDAFFYAHLSAFSPDAVERPPASRPAPCSASSATPATPSRPRRTSTSRSTPAASEDAIDPHAILLAWQENRDVAPGAWLTRHGGDTARAPRRPRRGPRLHRRVTESGPRARARWPRSWRGGARATSSTASPTGWLRDRSRS